MMSTQYIVHAGHISPLKSLKRINCSTSPRSGHDPARGFVIKLVAANSYRNHPSLCTTVKWLLFRSICPDGIATMYDIVVDLPVRSIFLACTGSLSVVIHTSVLSGMGGRSLAARCFESKFSFCCCFCFWSNALNSFRYGH